MSTAENAPTPEENFDCFLSYNRKDRDQVRLLDERLRAEAGLRPWLDEYTIPGGELFEPFIREALTHCASVVICLGPHGWGNFHRREAEIALGLRLTTPIRVIVAMLPNISEQDRADALTRFSDENCLDFHDDIDSDETFWALSKGIAPDRILPFEGPARLSLYEIRKNSREWDKSQRKNGDLLYRGSRLRQALAIAADSNERLNSSTQQFLLACKEAELQRSRRRLMMTAAVALSLGILAAVALWQRSVSARQATTATAGQVAARAESLRLNDASLLEQSVLLGLESLRIEDTPAGRQAAMNGIRWLLPPVAHLNRRPLIDLMRFGPNSRRLFIASGDSIEFWDLPGATKLMTVSEPSYVTALAVTAVPDELLASGTEDGDFSLRRVVDGELRFTMKLSGRIGKIAFGPGGSPMLVGTEGRKSL